MPNADPRHACPHCTRTLGDRIAIYSHVKAKHGRKAAQAFRPRPAQREPSMGSLVAEARADRAMGLPVEPWIEETFGEYL